MDKCLTKISAVWLDREVERLCEMTPRLQEGGDGCDVHALGKMRAEHYGNEYRMPNERRHGADPVAAAAQGKHRATCESSAEHVAWFVAFSLPVDGGKLATKFPRHFSRHPVLDVDVVIHRSECS